MKCPECDKELNENYVCKNCGKKFEKPEQEIEIEYKEFKISEFLEIRRKKNKSHIKNYNKTTIKKAPKTAFDRIRIPLREAKDKTTIKKRSVFVVLVAIFAGFIVIAGAFFLIRFLF